jgi:iron complex transport system ATP-binding protein
MSSMLSVESVSFAYNGIPVLQDASFRLEAGTASALIGVNGSGKTTLLRIAAGVLRPARGTVSLEGRLLHSFPLQELARNIALVPQQLEIPFAFSVQQVVEQGRTPYVGLLRGLGRGDRMAVDRALELTNLAQLRHRIFNELSGGEKQRVKIALALAQQPRLLLIDEPTQNLDIGRQVELIDLLDQLREEGMTILVAIHELHLVEENFSKVLLLVPGERLRCGSPDSIMQPQVLERAFQCQPGRYPLFRDKGVSR